MKIQRACFQSYCFEVELADSLIKKAIGLMFRKHLDQNKGMLFSFRKEKIIPIWMLNMRIPLDIIWIGENKKVTHIERNIQPRQGLLCSAIYPKERAKYVLEINAGVSQKLGILEGSTFKLV